jgi:nucleoside-triphosphatase
VHALIVGEQGVGKSTLIARVRKELGLREAGVETVREVSMTEERGAPVFLYRVGSPRTKGPDNLAAYVKPGGKTSFPQVFDRSAPLLKQDTGDAELIVLDELGFLEPQSPVFCRTVLDILDGNTPVIAAVKPMDTPFLCAVRSHQNARIFTIDETNRDALAGEVFAFLRQQTAKARQQS